MTTDPKHNRCDDDAVQYGDGEAALTPIEGAAHAGYIDASEGRGFSSEYTAQTGQWQRNYEAGRQWAVAILSIGAVPPMWTAGTRTPAEILALLDEVRRRTGSGTRPEDTPAWQRPEDDKRRVRAVVPVVRRGRIVERVTAEW